MARVLLIMRIKYYYLFDDANATVRNNQVGLDLDDRNCDTNVSVSCSMFISNAGSVQFLSFNIGLDKALEEKSN